ncbi:hypothetical protein B0O99DRAFT_499301 [Bisporella sp. PMI_857]|nr:hypothetical protein B0O99DRAFT_499301 [Bisporella sp. PMI_857]
MNNAQFRKLVLDTPARQPGSGEKQGTISTTSSRNGATPSALGSRMRSSIPMTPRSVGGVDFARQLAEQNRSLNPQPTKKFRSSAAPKGTKLAEGYVDRAKLREEQDEGDKAQRVKALEEMMKLQQIDEATFRKLRDEILGGDIGTTHLVKGLDWKLLERVREGEDVLNDKAEDDVEEDPVDVDEELDELENVEVKAKEREERQKKGEMAASSLIPGRKRTRDQILAEMKAARKAAQEAKGPVLGAKFKKVGEKRFEPRIERDSKGREVLITVDEHGNEKRKVRKVQSEPEEKGHGLLMPDKDAKPLGMEVPDIPKKVEEEEDIDIFDNVGDDYDPLAGLDENGESDAESEDGEVSEGAPSKKPKTEDKPEPGSMAPPPRPKPSAPRNYFGDTKPAEPEPSRPTAFQDPTILAAIKKAATLNPLSKEPENAEEAAREERRKKMLQQDDRDAQDMDLGFGSSRFEDEEDFEEKKVKLSKWGGGGNGDEDDGDGRGEKKEKRKRGVKKRKGDGNSAADVLRVLERRKAAEN